LAAGCLLTTNLDGFDAPVAADGAAKPTPTPAPPDATTETSTGLDASPLADASESGAPDPNLLFADDFNRADGPVGNGWLDPKSAYRIEDNHVPISGSNYCYECNTLYRPQTDDARDIKASIEFMPLSMPPSYPQVHVRAQPGDNYKCYAVGVPQTDSSFFFGRCAPANDFSSLGDQALTEKIVAGRTYRLSISAAGTNPVHLVMLLERKTDNGYSVIGKKEYDDADPNRVTEPGMYGISADTTPDWIYDNFVATKVGN
jgi:hypothetical protein